MLICPKRFILLLLFSVSVFFSKAQQHHFIYLQTENSGPFYIRFDNRVVSSSSSGYLIIPKLADSDYNVIVGFPKKEFPEENFFIKLGNKDEGYLLKNFNNQGWGLFNLQSYAVTMGIGATLDTSALSNVQNDPFSKMLATVVKDSTILQKREIPKSKEITKNDNTAVEKKGLVIGDSLVQELAHSSLNDSFNLSAKDSVNNLSAKIDSSKASILVKDSVTTVESSDKATVKPLLLSPATRISRKKTKEGIRSIYIDYNMDKDDTIKVFMPYENASINTVKKKDININDSIPNNVPLADTVVANVSSTDLARPPENAPNHKMDSASDSNSKTDTIAEMTQLPNSSDTGDKVSTSDSTKNNVLSSKIFSAPAVNSDCKAIASDEDFLKLRKKMAAENDNDEMIKIAKKVFRSKCFSTAQIKNLAFLFLTDEGKYMFFEVAYPFVSDSNQFPVLQSQITNTYYVNRFKAMINK